ncbi:cyclic nucleotide-binding domain-containing protein [Ancylobacter sonchi]|uniref:cyclic nucleotide-binding domain-containing protein n=1 Tax=Ancylobacter sonchi TaxID=1937790 RepID=UPI001BD5DBC9|nr:cyclic nucleotide-binding domain-containing protein [Ancylobacter sonchi]MBS7533741.1 cyclic nucleotide-binding domain-containing protein [Ancylobacter sonchi]
MAIEDDIALLEGVPLLQLLGREGLRVIAISGDTRRLNEGEVLFREGQFADAAYVVVSGRLRVCHENPARSAKPGHSEEVGPGTLLGEIALITDTKRPATATALAPSSVLRIPRVIFMRTVESYPESAVRIAEALGERVSATLAQLESVRRQLDEIGATSGGR